MQECGKSVSVKCGFLIVGEGLLEVKSLYLKHLMGHFPAGTQALAVSILLGDTESLSPGQRLLFETTGTQHLLAASGFNVSMVTSGVQLVMPRWSRRVRATLLVAGVWWYAVFANLGASIVRAAVMQSLSVIAYAGHWPYTPRWGLLVAVYLMFSFRPSYLTDIGFQLSVAATAAIIIGSQRAGEKSRWQKWAVGEFEVEPTDAELTLWEQFKEYWRDSLFVSGWAMVGTAPLLLYYFQEVNLWSLVLTGLVAWLIPPIMVGTLLASLISLIWGSEVASYVVHLLISLLVWLLKLGAYLPPLLLHRDELEWWYLPLFWGGVYLIHAWWRGRQKI